VNHTVLNDTVYGFSAVELARLATYRAAVRVGYFSDHGQGAHVRASAAHVKGPPAIAAQMTFPLTQRERTRMEIYRDAIRVGFFSDAEHPE
jgi:hypothetical protein